MAMSSKRIPATNNSGRTVELRGMRLCLHILAWCEREPQTARDMAAHCGRDHDVIILWCSHMHRLDMMRVVGWRKAKKGPRAAVYATGRGESVEPMKPRKQRKTRQMAGVAALAQMWSELQQPSMAADLVESSGLSKGTVCRMLREARALRLVRVAHWQRREGCGGTPTPMYELGSAPDAPKPTPQPPLVVAKRHRARLKTQRGVSRIVAIHVANAAAYRESA